MYIYVIIFGFFFDIGINIFFNFYFFNGFCIFCDKEVCVCLYVRIIYFFFKFVRGGI